MALSAVAHVLALAMMAGPWTEDAMVARAHSSINAKARWVRPLVRRVLAEFDVQVAEISVLESFIAEDEKFRKQVFGKRPPTARRWLLPETSMAMVSGPPSTFEVPRLENVGELAAWFNLSVAELLWFADARRYCETAPGKLRHYVCQWVAKRSVGHRLLAKPKRRLKSIQRAILRDILNRIPPSVHAHGFVKGRSVHSLATEHVGKRVVVRMDLANFFVSVRQARVAAIFRRVGYPREVATLLAALTTMAAPESAFRSYPGQKQDAFAELAKLRSRHLPQGAPTSPALSNLAAFALDRRLAGLANRHGASYARYADDLVFSGGAELSRIVRSFVHFVGAIVLDEGFEVNYRKTRVMRSGRRQQVVGLVVNQRPNVRRADYDRLRALLHNAGRYGAASQNRDGHSDFRAHLAGKIAWVARSNEARGHRLTRLFEKIDWST